MVILRVDGLAEAADRHLFEATVRQRREAASKAPVEGELKAPKKARPVASAWPPGKWCNRVQPGWRMARTSRRAPAADESAALPRPTRAA
jgi:hypothetical protein